jgi:hypothetical protein
MGYFLCHWELISDSFNVLCWFRSPRDVHYKKRYLWDVKIETENSFRNVGIPNLIHKFISVNRNLIGFKVLTAVSMKIIISWNITACSQLKVNRCFRGTCNFHSQDRKKEFKQDTSNECRWQNVLIFCPAPSLVETIFSFETSVQF